MNKTDSKIQSSYGREELLAKRREARAAQQEALVAQREALTVQLEANQLKRDEQAEKDQSTCYYCLAEVEPCSSVSIGVIEKACLKCVEEIGEEKIQRTMVSNHKIWEHRQTRNNKALKQCPHCNEYREKNTFSSFWTGKEYTDVCEICTDTCGETEIRDNLVYHKGTAPFMAGGLPTLGKKR